MPEERLRARSRSRDRAARLSASGRNRARRQNPISLEDFLLEVWSETATEHQRRGIRDFVQGRAPESWVGPTICAALSLLRLVCWESMVGCWNDWLFDSREDEYPPDPPERLHRLAAFACGVQLLHSLARDDSASETTHSVASVTIDID